MVSRLEEPVCRIEVRCVLDEIAALTVECRRVLASQNDEALTVLAQRIAVQARVIQRLTKPGQVQP
jgi:hypothetical protein